MELFQRGVGISQIAETMGLCRKTVRKWVQTSSFPERAQRRRCARKLDPFVIYLKQRWQEGCHNAAQLEREIATQGYAGSPSVVREYLGRWRAQLPAEQRSAGGSRPSKNHNPSPRSVMWLLLGKRDEKKPEKAAFQQRFVQALGELCPEVKVVQALALQFQELVRERRAAQLDAWIEAAVKSHLPELQSFARGLLEDKAAVVEALSGEWSNGQVEGQVHRLKLIKRSMYGRANFDLLRARVLPAVEA